MDVLCIKLPKGSIFTPTDEELIDFLRRNLSIFGGEIGVSSIKLSEGYRFHPTDKELIDFLRLKIEDTEFEVEEISEVDLCKWEPSELPSLSKIKNDDRQWYFFYRRSKKFSKSHRSNRATVGGFWKATGADRPIMSPSSGGKKLIGTKTTLVFYERDDQKNRESKKTNWIMHEYRFPNSAQDSFVLGRLFDKNENTEHSNSGDIEPANSSLTATTSSSPEGMPSNHAMVQAALLPDDESNRMSSDALVPKEGDDNNYMASYMEDEVAEMIPNEVDFSNAPTLETIDLKISSPLSSDMHNEEGYSCPNNSAIAFNNGRQSKDATDENNSSFEEFLDGLLNDIDSQVAQEQVNEKPAMGSE